MDGRKNMSEGAGDAIWLRYSTSITISGRPRTIEMGISVPVGASEDDREELLREANEGMNQLVDHVENRIAQMLQRVQPTQGNIPAPTPLAKPSVAPPPRAASRPNSAPIGQQMGQQAAPVQNLPNGTNNARPSSPVQPGQPGQPAQAMPSAREVREEHQEIVSPLSPAPQSEATPQNSPLQRSATGVSMPTTGDVSGNLSIPQFIRVVKDRFDLNPTQVMEMLKLKSLSGVNLREKLDQLQRLIDGDTSAVPEKSSESVDEKPSKPGGKSEAKSTPVQTPAKPQSASPSRPVAGETNSSRQKAQQAQQAQAPRPPATNKNGRVPHFDEEDDIEEILEGLDDDAELDELEQGRELTPADRNRGADLISKFRESQGAAQANPARLKVLTTVTDGQVSEVQLHVLAEGIWGNPSFKKLKVDQVESLISWAKEDDFFVDVDIVLALLEEEAFARGNR